MTERNTTAGVLIKDNLYLVARRKEGGPLSLKWEFIHTKMSTTFTYSIIYVRKYR